MKRRAESFVERVNLLFARTLVGGSDAPAAWDAVKELRGLGSRLVFEKAAAWCSSPSESKRERGVQILCQLRQNSRVPVYVQESFDLIADVIKSKPSNHVLLSCIYGFGHLDVAAALPLILPYADHEEADVRYAVTHALGAFHMHDEPDAVAALRKLMEDADRDIRNWAIFALGTQSSADSEELRCAFLAHLTDPYFEARAESAAALAKRQDLRVVKPLIEMFKKCAYIPISMTWAMDALLEEDNDSRWSADECIVALRTAFPETSGL